MESALCTANLTIFEVRRCCAASRSSVARGSSQRVDSSLSQSMLSGHLSMSLVAAGPSRRRARGVVVRAQSNGNFNKGPGSSGMSCGVPDGYFRACVDKVAERTEQGPCIFLRILDDGEMHRVVPVFIGKYECDSIVNAMKRKPHSRPLTYDLINNAIEALDYKVAMVQMTHLRDGTYYGRIFFRRYLPATGEYDVRDVDARPSDAINVAVRSGAPIFVNTSIVSSSALDASPGVEYFPSYAYEAPAPKKVKKLDSAIAVRMQLAVAVAEKRYDDAESLSKVIAAMTGHDEGSGLLILQMEQAVREERYQDAARLRDKLAQMNHELSE